MECIGRFYYGLLEIERRILSERYLQTGTEKERARRLSMSVGSMRRKIDRLLERCVGYLQCGGFL